MAKDERYSDEETARRRDELAKRMLATPPKPHSEMKLGKRKPKAKGDGVPKDRHSKTKEIAR
jgi:hypothetical protein